MDIGIPRTVISRGGAMRGKPTGSQRPCSLEGCGGRRITVRWPDGKVTHPCSKGMDWSPKGQTARII